MICYEYLFGVQKLSGRWTVLVEPGTYLSQDVYVALVQVNTKTL